MSQYAKGARWERQVADHFTARGWLASRAAGSHGAADVVALKAGHDPLLVQCKTNGAFPPRERLALLEAADKAGAVPLLADRPARGKMRVRRVMTQGYDEWV